MRKSIVKLRRVIEICALVSLICAALLVAHLWAADREIAAQCGWIVQ